MGICVVRQQFNVNFLFLAPLTIVRRSLSDTNLSGVRRRTSTFSNCYFSYIFQWILWKLGTLISWVSPQTLFFSEF